MEAGDGCTRDLIELGRMLQGQDENATTPNLADLIPVVMISHPHYDHYAGLLNLLNLFHLLGRTKTLKVIYPEGADAIEKLLDHFIETLWEKCPFDMERIGFGDPSSIRSGETMINTIPVKHRYSRPGAVGDRVPAMAYEISNEGERICYTGDTCGSRELADFIKGSDLALIEATYDRTPPGHEEVHLDVDKARNLASLSRQSWFVHFTARSYEKLSRESGDYDGSLPMVPKEEKP
jgi:ribonuclease BN (tRNA processing enzyme)